MPTISISKGRGYAGHNNRSIDRVNSRSWDPSLSDRNIVYRDEPIREVYAELFGEALTEYNAGQVEKGHPERQIKDYYEHVSRSKQEKPVYELIVQIGDIYDKHGPEYEAIQNALDDYCRGFQKRNPNFRVAQMITHRDEAGMDHTHIQFVPWSDGNRRGLRTKNTMSGALKAMGYGRQGFADWRRAEQSAMEQSMQRFGLSVEAGSGRQEHMSVAKYKALVDEMSDLSEQNKALEARLDETRTQIQKAEADLLSTRSLAKTVNELQRVTSGTAPGESMHLTAPSGRVSKHFRTGETITLDKREWDGYVEAVSKLVDEHNSLLNAYASLKRVVNEFIEPFRRILANRQAKTSKSRDVAKNASKVPQRPVFARELDSSQQRKQNDGLEKARPKRKNRGLDR